MVLTFFKNHSRGNLHKTIVCHNSPPCLFNSFNKEQLLFLMASMDDPIFTSFTDRIKHVDLSRQIKSVKKEIRTVYRQIIASVRPTFESIPVADLVRYDERGQVKTVTRNGKVFPRRSDSENAIIERYNNQWIQVQRDQDQEDLRVEKDPELRTVLQEKLVHLETDEGKGKAKEKFRVNIWVPLWSEYLVPRFEQWRTETEDTKKQQQMVVVDDVVDFMSSKKPRLDEAYF